jgi:hypothetical protein
VSIKFKATDTNYTKLAPRVLENLEDDLLSYGISNEQFFVVSDKSTFIYPSPTENITAGMIIYGIMYPQKLTLASEETLDDDISKAILLGIAERYFTSQKLTGEAQLAGAKFTAECDRVCLSLSSRMQSPVNITTPNLSRYC